MGSPSATFVLESGDGFTVFEMIIVISVVTILVATTVPRFINSFVNGSTQTADDARDIQHLFETGRQYAIANRESDNWGIHLVDNGTTDCGSGTTVDCVVLYKGKSFTARDTAYDTVVTLRANNYLTSLEGIDYYFQRFSGYLMNTYGFPPNPQAHYSFDGDYNNDPVSGGVATTTDVTGHSYDAVRTELYGGANAANVYTTLSRGTAALSTWAGEQIDIPNTLLGNQAATGFTYALEWTAGTYGLDFALIGGAPTSGHVRYSSGGLWIDASGVPKVECYDTEDFAYRTAALGYPFTTYVSHHIAGTYNPTDLKVRLYIDGDLATETSTVNSCGYTSMGESYIGLNSKSDDRMNSQGDFDEVFVYDRPLSAMEIKGLAVYSRSTTTDEVINSKIYVANGTVTSTVELNNAGFVRYY
jgi:Tfp pilus assembly protein PilE